MRSLTRILSATFILGFVSITSASADYVTAPVAGGGTLSGKISFKGAQPAPEQFDFSKFPQSKFCSQVDSDGKAGSGEGHRLRQDVKVKDGGLGDAVVYIVNIEQGKAFSADAETKIVADNCRFLIEGGPSKSVGVVFNAKKSGVKDPKVSVTNKDADPSDPKTIEGILHNPHGYDMQGKMSTTLFNKPVPKKGQTISEKVLKTWFKKDEAFMKVECDQHNYMNVWALPVSNPYYAIVKEDGTYSIDQVPPGKYEVKSFHPKLGFQTAQIEVKAGATTANFEYAAK